jgi:lipoprotein-releasing system permease protein
LNTEFFIAKRIVSGGKSSDKISKPIIRIAIAGISLGIMVMILAVAIVTGFQSEIRDKVIGFGSHIQITSFNSNDSYESSQLHIDQTFYPGLDSVDGVRHIQIYAIKPGVMKAKRDSQVVKVLVNGIEQDSVVYYEDIEAVIVKGIGTDFDWDFFSDKIIEGKALAITDDVIDNHILVSKYICTKLDMKLGDTIPTFFFKGDDDYSQSNFVIGGIYKTGMDEFDKKFVFTDIKEIQRQNNWGIEAFLLMDDKCINGAFKLKANAFGGNVSSNPGLGNEPYYKYNWNGGDYFFNDKFEIICPIKDTTVQLIVSDFYETKRGDEIMLTVPDTAWLEIKVRNTTGESMPDTCYCNVVGEIETESFDEAGTHRLFHVGDIDIETKLTTSGGSRKYYVGGFEVLLDDWDDLKKMNSIIEDNIIGPELRATPITEQYKEIFSWLKMIDYNVIIIVILMAVVAVINMASALLILILERTNMIGILKAMGSSNWAVRKVFLYNAAYLIGKGLLYGNIAGISLALIQQHFGLFTLNQETYYIATVPIILNIQDIILLNLGTMLFCLGALMLPSFLVTKISPIKAIRFN